MKETVLLLPGYLGFSHYGDTSYFTDRFVAGLAGALEGRKANFVSVLRGPPPGNTSLQARQMKLLELLEDLIERYDAVHLVGHSTGGVDAMLLSQEQPLTAFSAFDRVKAKIGSVVTLAAPILGTTIARSPIAQEIRAKQPTETGVEDLFLLARAGMERDLLERAAFAYAAAGGSGIRDLVRTIFEKPQILEELDPAYMTRVWAENRTDPAYGFPVRHIVTMTPKAPNDWSDALFALLQQLVGYDLTGPDIGPNILRLARLADTAIDERTNDGFVNSARQIPADVTDEEIITVLSADHSDVLGWYYREDEIENEVVDEGLLISGADFDDSHFYAMLDRIAIEVGDASA